MISIRCCHPACDAGVTERTMNVAHFQAGRRGLRRCGPHWYCADHIPESPKCPHGAGRPDQCSQCLGVVARKVTLGEDGVLVCEAATAVNQKDRERSDRLRASALRGSINAMGRKARRATP